MYKFKKEYTHSIKSSFLSNPRGFAFWLYYFYNSIKAASDNDEVDFKQFRNVILDMVNERAEHLPGLDRFTCDAYGYRTKEQLLERCEIAIENARALPV